jgi:hypothetical protein
VARVPGQPCGHKQIHEAEGTAKIWIENTASPEQRQALEQILKVNLGGPPWIIFTAIIDRWWDTDVKPLQWNQIARPAASTSGTSCATMEPMRNAVNGKQSACQDRLAGRSGLQRTEYDVIEAFSVFTPGLKYAWAEKMAW